MFFCPIDLPQYTILNAPRCLVPLFHSVIFRGGRGGMAKRISRAQHRRLFDPDYVQRKPVGTGLGAGVVGWGWRIWAI